MARKLTQKKVISLVSALVILAIAVSQHFGWLEVPKQSTVENNPGLYSINRYIDGDTISVNMNGTNETVRMIGVDTPETHKPNTPVQCYGPAAAAYTKNLISTAGGKVRLESDPKSQNRDRYDRLLRYVYLTNGRLVQLETIKNGYGFAYTQFPFTKSDEFVKAETEAKIAVRGLWANCTVNEMNGRKQTNKTP